MSVGVCVPPAMPDAARLHVGPSDPIAIVAATRSVLDLSLIEPFHESHPQARLGQEGKRGTRVLLADLDLREDT